MNIITGVCLLTGCAAFSHSDSRREQLILRLEHELKANSGWVQVHAADALLDHGEASRADASFAPIGDAPPKPFRIGVWRVLARAAKTKRARLACIENIQKVLHDRAAPDRLQAAESLAKLQVLNDSNRALLHQWLSSAAESSAAFARWLLVISSPPADRPAEEARLAALLDSADPIARLRAAFALGRLPSIGLASRNRLRQQLDREPADSPARIYVLSANLRRSGGDSPNIEKLTRELAAMLFRAKPAEQLEGATVLGQYGGAEARSTLEALLASPEPDARIGAASGLLYLLRE